MVWLFERDSESFKIETYYDNESSEFVLIVHEIDGRPRIERFRTANAFRSRLDTLERQLTAERWVQHGPTFLHDGWKV